MGELVRVKAYGEPPAAFAVYRPSIDRWQVVYLVSFDAGDEGAVWLTDAELSGPGWRDAAVLPLPDPADTPQRSGLYTRLPFPTGVIGWVQRRYDGYIDTRYEHFRSPGAARARAAALLAAAAWVEREGGPNG